MTASAGYVRRSQFCFMPTTSLRNVQLFHEAAGIRLKSYNGVGCLLWGVLHPCDLGIH